MDTSKLVIDRIVKTILSFMAISFIMAIGCESPTPSEESLGATDQELSVTNQTLDTAMSTCHSTFQNCRSIASDSAKSQSCKDDLKTCLGDAAGQVEKNLQAASTCGEDAKRCASEANQDREALDACLTTLKTCLVKIVPATDQTTNTSVLARRDADTVVGAECAKAMKECVKAGKDAKTCAADAKTCWRAEIADVDAAVPELPDSCQLLIDALPGANCINTLKECVKAGKDVETCAADAKTCLDGSVPTTISGADCAKAMKECVKGGKDAKTCASDAKTCIEALPESKCVLASKECVKAGKDKESCLNDACTCLLPQVQQE
jgi:hypothetical protein